MSKARTISVADEIASRLRSHRARLDLTQEQAAERAGMSWMSLHRYERGKMPTLDALYRIARVYGVSAHDLIPG